MSDGDSGYRKKHFITYIIFLVLLAINYFLVPSEYFNPIFWGLLILFAIAEIYFLFTARKKKTDYTMNDYSREARIARIIFLGLITVSNLFTPTDELSGFIFILPIVIVFIAIDALLLFDSRTKSKSNN